MKILFIACYSPLINNSASIETLQYLNNLAKIKGNEIHLLTVNFPNDSIYYDEYIFNMLDKRVKLHIISGGKIFEKIMPKKDIIDYTKKKDSKLKIFKFLKKIKKIFAVPDIYLYWAIKASRYGKKLFEEERIDVIFSMHEPPSSHICAYRIKRKFKNTKWVAYWSDPWLKDSTRASSTFVRKRFEAFLEKKIIKLTDKNIFVTKENREDYIKTYNLKKENTFIVTRGYDRNLYDSIRKCEYPKLIDRKKINMVYTGEIFSKLRDIGPFIEALNKLRDRDLELFNRLNILFFGNIDDIEFKNKLISIENVKVYNRIPYNEALSYMINSDILILFGNKNSKQIPAKIYDYFGCDGNILVILGDDKDPIKYVVNNIEKCTVTENKSDNILIKINDIVNGIDNKKSFGPIKEYEWENISKKLDFILREE